MRAIEHAALHPAELDHAALDLFCRDRLRQFHFSRRLPGDIAFAIGDERIDPQELFQGRARAEVKTRFERHAANSLRAEYQRRIENILRFEATGGIEGGGRRQGLEGRLMNRVLDAETRSAGALYDQITKALY